MASIETPPDPAHSLAAFVGETREQAGPDVGFSCESSRILRIDVRGDVWLKPGAAIAHRGDLVFERRQTLRATSASDAVLRETAPLVRAIGHGRLYCADHASHVRVITLERDAIVVNWSELLAFESSLTFETRLVGHGVGLAAGGLAVVRLEGRGAVALATHGQPLTLEVTPGTPVNTDPHATLAWSAALDPTLKTDLTWRSLVAHGGGEPVQMHFSGRGFVVVQPFEDPSRFHLSASPLKRLASLITA